MEMTPADADAKVVAKRRGGNNYIGREPAAAPGCDAAARLLLEALRKSLPSCDVRSRAEKILTSEIALSSSFSSDRTGVVVARTSWKSRPAKKQQTPPAKGKGGELEALAAAIYRAFCYEGRKQQQRHSRHTGDEGDSDFIESQQRLERGYYPTNFRCAEKDATSDITGRGKTDASAETEKQHRGQLGLQKEIGDRCEGAIWRAATSANSPLPAPPCMGVGKTIHNQCQVTPGASVARGEEEEEHERSLSPPPFSLLEFSTADAGPESGPQKQTPPLVSDSDESSAAATNASLSSSSSDGRQVGAGAAYCGDLSPTSLWGSFMECVKLNVVATTATNKGIGGSSRPAATSHDKMGKKKRKEAVYEVYRLAGPAAGVPPVCHDGDVGALRTKIQDEFLALFDGCMEGGGASGKTTTTRLARKTRLLMRDCRVHAIWCHPRQQLQKSPQETRTASRERQQESQKNLWIQVNIGPSGYSCKKGVSTSAGAEFTAIVTPGSDCVAIGAMTAPGAPAVSSSRSRLLTPIVLSALESAVTSTESDSYSDIGTSSFIVRGRCCTDVHAIVSKRFICSLLRSRHQMYFLAKSTDSRVWTHTICYWRLVPLKVNRALSVDLRTIHRGRRSPTPYQIYGMLPPDLSSPCKRTVRELPPCLLRVLVTAAGLSIAQRGTGNIGNVIGKLPLDGTATVRA